MLWNNLGNSKLSSAAQTLVRQATLNNIYTQQNIQRLKHKIIADLLTSNNPKETPPNQGFLYETYMNKSMKTWPHIQEIFTIVVAR